MNIRHVSFSSLEQFLQTLIKEPDTHYYITDGSTPMQRIKFAGMEHYLKTGDLLVLDSGRAFQPEYIQDYAIFGHCNIGKEYEIPSNGLICLIIDGDSTTEIMLGSTHDGYISNYGKVFPRDRVVPICENTTEAIKKWQALRSNEFIYIQKSKYPMFDWSKIAC